MESKRKLSLVTHEEVLLMKKLKADYPNILDFSDCVLTLILSYLDSYDLYLLSKTCNRFKYLIKERKLWKHVDIVKYPMCAKKFAFFFENINNMTDTVMLSGIDRKEKSLTSVQMHKLFNLCEHLTIISIENQYINSDEVRLSQFPKSLKELSLRGTHITGKQPFLQNAHKKLANLHTLILDNCKWFHEHSLMALSKLPSLENLSLYNCRNLNDSVAYMSVTARFGFTKLLRIDARCTAIGDQFLKCFHCIKTLREIYLESPPTCPNKRGNLFEEIKRWCTSNMQALPNVVIFNQNTVNSVFKRNRNIRRAKKSRSEPSSPVLKRSSQSSFNCVENCNPCSVDSCSFIPDKYIFDDSFKRLFNEETSSNKTDKNEELNREPGEELFFLTEEPEKNVSQEISTSEQIICPRSSIDRLTENEKKTTEKKSGSLKDGESNDKSKETAGSSPEESFPSTSRDPPRPSPLERYKSFRNDNSILLNSILKIDIMENHRAQASASTERTNENNADAQPGTSNESNNERRNEILSTIDSLLNFDGVQVNLNNENSSTRENSNVPVQNQPENPARHQLGFQENLRKYKEKVFNLKFNRKANSSWSSSSSDNSPRKEPPADNSSKPPTQSNLDTSASSDNQSESSSADKPEVLYCDDVSDSEDELMEFQMFSSEVTDAGVQWFCNSDPQSTDMQGNESVLFKKPYNKCNCDIVRSSAPLDEPGPSGLNNPTTSNTPPSPNPRRRVVFKRKKCRITDPPNEAKRPCPDKSSITVDLNIGEGPLHLEIINEITGMVQRPQGREEASRNNNSDEEVPVPNVPENPPPQAPPPEPRLRRLPTPPPRDEDEVRNRDLRVIIERLDPGLHIVIDRAGRIQFGPMRANNFTKLKVFMARGYKMITDQALRSLSDLRLELLDVTGTSVTPSGIQQFLMVNPDCRVIHESTCNCG